MRHPPKPPAPAISWSGVKLLVFSRDEAFRFMVRTTFRKLGVADVLSTGTAEDAEHLAGHAPNLALVDFEGAGDEAIHFLTRLRDAPRNPDPDLPVLATQRPGTALPGKATAMGLAGTLPKPISRHELTVRIWEILKTAEAARSQPATPPPAAKPAPIKAGAPPPARPAPAAPAPVAAKPAPAPAPLPVPVARPSLPAMTAAPRTAPQKLGDGDLAGLAPGKASGSYELVAPPARPKAAKPRASDEAWQAALEQSGHHARTGTDVAGLDVSAIVAAHVDWLKSKGAEGQRATFQGMDLAGADLAGTLLANATFRDADLCDARLAEARLDGADFRYAKLDAADLNGANLGVAQMRHAKARLANLEGAILRGSDLSGADLRGAMLTGADIKGAIMISTDLSGTDLSAVENMSQAQADRAVTDGKTKLPPGIRRARLD